MGDGALDEDDDIVLDTEMHEMNPEVGLIGGPTWESLYQ